MSDENHIQYLANLEETAYGDSNNVQNWQDLANAYVNLGQWDNAERAYQTAIRSNPEIANLHNDLASVYEELNDAEQAEKAY